MTTTTPPVTVLIVDDSDVVRRALANAFDVSGFSVIGQASTGREAIAKAIKLKPRLITMDLDMPDVDGLAAIEQIMAEAPTRILVITGVPLYAGHDSTFEALSRGALEVLPKPTVWPQADREKSNIIRVARRLAAVPVVPHVRAARQNRQRLRAQYALEAAASASSRIGGRPAIVAIGASTGGPGIIRAILSELPRDLDVPVFFVQHLADVFTAGFLEWLGSASHLPVVEALPGSRIEPHKAFVATRGSHVVVSPQGLIESSYEPPREGHCPSIDVLFESVAKVFGPRSIGVLLTGMGTDGAAGLKAIADAGGATLVQDESSSVVFGMPKAALDLCAAHKVVSKDHVASSIAHLIGEARSR
jgi:two-component system, chemotaxis family, protein-glutamate methylesterase/glutaminase